MAKRYFAYVLFALGFVTVTFFRNYAGQNIPYPFVFWIAGALMYGYGLKLLYWTPNFREQKALNIRKNEIDDLITKGDKIAVDLDTCEIKENNYIFEKDKRRGRYNSTEDNDLSFEMKIRINSTKSLTNSFDNVDQYQINQSENDLKIQQQSVSSLLFSNYQSSINNQNILKKYSKDFIRYIIFN